MRVLLVSVNTERINMPTMPLGLALVAEATARAGHEVRLLDLLFEADPAGAVRGAVEELRPEAIGLSIRNIDDQEMAAPRFLLDQARPVVDACRASSDAPIVLGGAGYSIFPDATLERLGADLGVRGDGEVAFPALLARLAAGGDPAGIPGLHVRGRGGSGPLWPRALDDQPLVAAGAWAAPYRDLDGLWVPVQSRRGCPQRCAYCSTFAIQGRRVRCRSPRLVAESVGRLHDVGFRRFYLVDNSFNVPEEQGLELCRRIAERAPGAELRCILYPGPVSAELLDAMAAAGVVEVALGFESGDDGVLRSLGKHFVAEEVRRLSGELAARRIRRVGFLLLGGPGETRETVERSLAFARSLDLDALRTTVGIRVYPGTPLHHRALAEGALAPEDDLLEPRFYLAPGLASWIHEAVQTGFRPRG